MRLAESLLHHKTATTSQEQQRHRDQQAKQQGGQPLFGALRQLGREEADHQQGAERDQQALSGNADQLRIH